MQPCSQRQHIGVVMGYTLLLKKIERIGDQAKNILDLAEDGISLSGAPDIEDFLTRRQTISQMYVDAADILVSLDVDSARQFLDRSMEMNRECEQKIHSIVLLSRLRLQQHYENSRPPQISRGNPIFASISQI